MAAMIILVDADRNQVEKLVDVDIQDEDWEEGCYQLGCKVAREVAARYLEDKAEQLDKERLAGFHVRETCQKNTKERTLVTRQAVIQEGCGGSSRYAAGVLGASTVHRLLSQVSHDVIEEEKQEWRSCFQKGFIPPHGKRKVAVLYTEADGLVVHLQQEGQNKCQSIMS